MVTLDNRNSVDVALQKTKQNLSTNISFATNTVGYNTPSTNYLSYIINSDNSVTYREQNQNITVSCSEQNSDLYYILQAFTVTNNVNGGYTGYDNTGFINRDALHTTGPDLDTVYYYGVWFEYNFTDLGGLQFNKVTVNIPDYNNSPSQICILGTNDKITWQLLNAETSYDYLTNQVNSHTYDVQGGSITYNYCRVIITQCVNQTYFCISSIQFLNDTIISSRKFGTQCSNYVTLGTFNQPLYLRYSYVVRNLEGSAQLLLNTDIDNTFPPTSTDTNKPVSADIARQIYNASAVTPKFYFRYNSTTSTINTTTTPLQILGNASFTLSQNNLNGLSISSVISANKFIAPYNGIYSISASTFSGVPQYNKFTIISSSGTYSTDTLLVNGGYSTPISISHTLYLATNDQIQITITSNTTSSFTGGGCYSVYLVTKM